MPTKISMGGAGIWRTFPPSDACQNFEDDNRWQHQSVILSASCSVAQHAVMPIARQSVSALVYKSRHGPKYRFSDAFHVDMNDEI